MVKMGRVLIAWELGGAYGHLMRCLRLAAELGQKGHAVTLALKQAELPSGFGWPTGVEVQRTPLPARTYVRRPPVNFAALLSACGFECPEDLALRLRTWRRILDQSGADVVVADHAPTALLAARISGVPSLAVGSAFAVPPALHPWPSIRPWERVSEGALRASERQLDEQVTKTLRLIGYPEPLRMREVFEVEALFDTFAELDHYGLRRGGRYIGCMWPAPVAHGVPWQFNTDRRVLCYLRPEVPGFEQGLAALARSGAEAICVVPKIDASIARRYATKRMRIASVPLDFSELLPEANLAVCYGSSAFSTEALLAGVPLLMRPQHVEQWLFARRVVDLGCGCLVPANAGITEWISGLNALLEEPGYQTAARAFGDRNRPHSGENAVVSAVRAIEAHLPANAVPGVDLPGYRGQPSS